MDETLITLALLFGALALVVGSLIAGAIRNDRGQAAWSEIARRKGLALEGTHPKLHLHGTLDGLAVSVEQRVDVSTGGRARIRRSHHLVVALPVEVGDLRVEPRDHEPGPPGAIATGDADFDRAFWVSGSDRGLARKVLHARARAALLDARPLGRWTLAQGALQLHRGELADPESLLPTLEGLVRAALALEPRPGYRES